MSNRTRVFAGSIVGALTLHVAMVACGGGAGVSPAGNGGLLDALVDAARDALDAETRDAHAGGDGGVVQPQAPGRGRVDVAWDDHGRCAREFCDRAEAAMHAEATDAGGA